MVGPGGEGGSALPVWEGGGGVAPHQFSPPPPPSLHCISRPVLSGPTRASCGGVVPQARRSGTGALLQRMTGLNGGWGWGAGVVNRVTCHDIYTGPQWEIAGSHNIVTAKRLHGTFL